MECLWYNGELGHYVLLDFDPKGLTKKQIMEKAKVSIQKLCGNILTEEELEKAMETVYLIKVDDLKPILKE